MQDKYCPNCQQRKSLTDFASNRSRADGVCYRCKACDAAGARARRAAKNPDRAREWARRARLTPRERQAEAKRRHRERHRERLSDEERVYKALKKADGSLTVAEWVSLREQFGNRCLACGSTTRLEIDHIVPISAGGRTDADNVQLLCRSCNRSKWRRTLDYRPQT